MDTPITVQTTPRQLGKLVGSLGVSGATLYGAYAGARMLPYLNTVYAGSALAKGTLGLSLIVTVGLFGLGTHIIGQRLGPRGPYFNVTIGQPAVDVNQNTTTTNNAIQSATVDCPLEVGEVVFNPFYNIAPLSDNPDLALLSDNPDLALLSVSILMLIFGIQCFNFILIRTIIIRNSSRILLYLKDYPSIYKVIETIIFPEGPY